MDKKPYNPGPRPVNSNGNNNANRGPQQRRPERNAYPNNINEHIRAREVRLVGDNVTVGIYSIHEALKIAEDLELDLVEISPNAEPEISLSAEEKSKRDQGKIYQNRCQGNPFRTSD